MCASSFIEYLARLEIGKETGPEQYKNFLKDRFFAVCPKYATFQYASGKRDLAVQMYHVLRCGSVHSFSLIADPKAKARDGRDRSILLAHRKPKVTHLANYVNPAAGIDAAVFVAQDFIEDIARVADSLFADSRKRTKKGNELRQNIKNWFNAHPPIGIQMF